MAESLVGLEARSSSGPKMNWKDYFIGRSWNTDSKEWADPPTGRSLTGFDWCGLPLIGGGLLRIGAGTNSEFSAELRWSGP